MDYHYYRSRSPSPAGSSCSMLVRRSEVSLDADGDGLSPGIDGLISHDGCRYSDRSVSRSPVYSWSRSDRSGSDSSRASSVLHGSQRSHHGSDYSSDVSPPSDHESREAPQPCDQDRLLSNDSQDLDLSSSHSQLGPSSPVYADSSQLGPSSPVYADSSQLGPSSPVYSCSSQLGPSSPVYADSSQLGPSSPVYADSSQLGPSSPVYADSSQLGPSSPVYADSSQLGPSSPVYSCSSQLGPSSPVYSWSSQLGPSSPVYSWSRSDRSGSDSSRASSVLHGSQRSHHGSDFSSDVSPPSDHESREAPQPCDQDRLLSNDSQDLDLSSSHSQLGPSSPVYSWSRSDQSGSDFSREASVLHGSQRSHHGSDFSSDVSPSDHESHEASQPCDQDCIRPLSNDSQDLDLSSSHSQLGVHCLARPARAEETLHSSGAHSSAVRVTRSPSIDKPRWEHDILEQLCSFMMASTHAREARKRTHRSGRTRNGHAGQGDQHQELDGTAHPYSHRDAELRAMSPTSLQMAFHRFLDDVDLSRDVTMHTPAEVGSFSSSSIDSDGLRHASLPVQVHSHEADGIQVDPGLVERSSLLGDAASIPVRRSSMPVPVLGPLDRATERLQIHGSQSTPALFPTDLRVAAPDVVKESWAHLGFDVLPQNFCPTQAPQQDAGTVSFSLRDRVVRHRLRLPQAPLCLRAAEHVSGALRRCSTARDAGQQDEPDPRWKSAYFGVSGCSAPNRSAFEPHSGATYVHARADLDFGIPLSLPQAVNVPLATIARTEEVARASVWASSHAALYGDASFAYIEKVLESPGSSLSAEDRLQLRKASSLLQAVSAGMEASLEWQMRVVANHVLLRRDAALLGCSLPPWLRAELRTQPIHGTSALFNGQVDRVLDTARKRGETVSTVVRKVRSANRSSRRSSRRARRNRYRLSVAASVHRTSNPRLTTASHSP